MMRLIPRQTQSFCGGCLVAGSRQHINSKTLEYMRKACPRICPWHFQAFNPMRLTMDARNRSDQQRLELHRIKGAPCPLLTVVIDRTKCIAVATQPLRSLWPTDMDGN